MTASSVLLGIALAILKFNLYSYAVIFSVAATLHVVFTLAPGKGGPRKLKPGRKEFASTDIYQRWIKPEYKGWFTLEDVACRYALAVLGFYIALFTRPIRFIHFNFLALRLWCSWAEIAYYFMLLPLLPFTCVLFEGAIRPAKIALGLETDWSAGTGGCFFARPDGVLTRLLWDGHIWLSVQVGQFYVVGTHSRSLQGSYRDVELNKFFWRQTLLKVNAGVAPELARWDGKGGLTLGKDQSKKAKVFCKASDECLGTGDARIYDYDPVAKFDEVKAFMAKHYPDQPALIMDFALPSKDLGVHTYDILTLTRPDGSVQVLSSLLWGECGSADTSHGCNAGFALDAFDEKVCGGIGHYTAFFADEKNFNKKMLGKHIKKLQEACKTAVAAHKEVNKRYNWCPGIGWDCMLDERDNIVFFEGNQASNRLPRLMFLNRANLMDFLSDFFWPFDDAQSVQPLHTKEKTD